MNTYRKSTVPLILNFGAKWKWVANLEALPLLGPKITPMLIEYEAEWTLQGLEPRTVHSVA
jgi:hypothetical protein